MRKQKREHGEAGRKPVNVKATKLLAEAGGMSGDNVLGDVLVCDESEVE